MKYLTRSIGQIFNLYLLVYAVLIIVFAIEQFDSVLRTAIEYGVSPTAFSRLFVFALPEVADFIIPVSVLVSVYFVLLYKREGREFLTLAAAGSDVRPVVVLVCLVSGLFFGVSVFISGYLKPAAAYAYRSESTEAVAKFVSEGPQNGQFTYHGNKIFHVSDRRSDGERALRMFEFDNERLERLIISDCSNLLASRGDLIVNSCSARIYDFNPPAAPPIGPDPASPGDCRICADASGRLNLTVIEVGESAMLFPLNSLVGGALGVQHNERPLHDLLSLDDNGRFRSGADVRDAAKILLLGLTSVLAAAIAVAAVALTSYRNRFAVLPSAIAVVMMISVAASSGFLVPELLPGAAGFWVAVLMAAALCFGSILIAFNAMRSRLLMPGFARA